MGVPLKVNSHTFGALVVQTYSKNIRYGERDKEILTFVASQLASAVEIKRNEQALRRSEPVTDRWCRVRCTAFIVRAWKGVFWM